MLLEEFENVPAVIEPTDRSIRGGGEICDTIILSFNGEILERVKQIDGVYEGGYLTNLNGKLPWYIYEKDGSKVAVAMALIGAPMVVGLLEELKARGFKNFIVLGSCGVLDQSIQADKIILPSSALRDEGTSYHYAPASDEVAYDESLLVKLEAIFDKHNIEHIRTKAWTTDAFYRETLDKVKRRLAAGAQVWWIWKLQLSWLGVNFARARSINSSTQLTMWIIITESGMPAMKSGQLMP